ncbi:MAG: hypothetical protein F6K23_34910 [Okeania sp. SIO2C9]|uniref:hypothetical protein n=1 Tax=Okeania sp. SIO2C9 TaxID=2607791 RepID=UPI0013C1F8A7|nr:hypothetical protein [Okeania sp. SIO2C9]NEQ77749.1 hypothetical protein [Okeania sp. SIO2C9]
MLTYSSKQPRINLQGLYSYQLSVINYSNMILVVKYWKLLGNRQQATGNREEEKNVSYECNNCYILYF